MRIKKSRPDGGNKHELGVWYWYYGFSDNRASYVSQSRIHPSWYFHNLGAVTGGDICVYIYLGERHDIDTLLDLFEAGGEPEFEGRA